MKATITLILMVLLLTFSFAINPKMTKITNEQYTLTLEENPNLILDYYLSPSGNDLGFCTLEYPCLTFDKAFYLAKQMDRNQINIYLEQGTYNNLIAPNDERVFIIGEDKNNTFISSTATNCVQANNTYLYLDKLTIQGCYLGITANNSIVDIADVDTKTSSGIYANRNSYINLVAGSYKTNIRRTTIGGSGINIVNGSLSIGHDLNVGNFSQNIIANYGSSLSLSNYINLTIQNDVNSNYTTYTFGLRVFNNSVFSNGAYSKINIDGYNYANHHNVGIQIMNNSTMTLNAYTDINVINYDYGITAFNNSVINTGTELTSLNIIAKDENVAFDYTSQFISGHNLNQPFKNAVIYDQPIENEDSRMLGSDFRYLKLNDYKWELSTLFDYNTLNLKDNLSLVVNGFIYVPNEPIIIDNGHSFNMCNGLDYCTELRKQDVNNIELILPVDNGTLLTREDILDSNIFTTYNVMKECGVSCYMSYNKYGLLIDSNCSD